MNTRSNFAKRSTLGRARSEAALLSLLFVFLTLVTVAPSRALSRDLVLSAPHPANPVQVPTTGFTMTVNPPSMMLQAGSSSSSTLTLTSLNGFSGVVSLTVRVQAPVFPWPVLRVTGSASPASVTLTPDGAANSTILISTSPSTTTGSYTIWIDATGGGQFHQAVIDAGVGPYFTLTASTSNLIIRAGSTKSSRLVLTSHANFPFSANFEINVYLQGSESACPTYCPIYPTVSISPSTVSLPALGTSTAVLTVLTATNDAQGTYRITVWGGGCVCILPYTTVNLSVIAHPDIVGGILSTVGKLWVQFPYIESSLVILAGIIGIIVFLRQARKQREFGRDEERAKRL